MKNKYLSRISASDYIDWYNYFAVGILILDL